MKYKIQYQVLELQDNAEAYIKKPENCYEVLKEEFTPIQETITIIGLNIKNKVIFKKTVAIGGHNAILITPKDIFTHLLLNNCINFVIAHNHPSEDLTPSNEDILFTKKIQKASEIMGINLLDHIIYNQDNFNSLKKQGLI